MTQQKKEKRRSRTEMRKVTRKSSLKNYYTLLGIKPTKSKKKIQEALEKKLRENQIPELEDIYKNAERKIMKSLDARTITNKRTTKPIKKKKETQTALVKKEEKEKRKPVKTQVTKEKPSEKKKVDKKKKTTRRNIFCAVALVCILTTIIPLALSSKKKSDQAAQIKQQQEEELQRQKIEKESKAKQEIERAKKEIKEYESIPSYDPTKLERYKAYKKKNNTSVQDAVLQVNIGLDKEFYTDVVEIQNPESNLVLVNKYNKLPSDYEPKDLQVLENHSQYKLRKEAAEAYNQLAREAEKAGVIVEPFSAYRPYYYQETVYNRHLQEYNNDLEKVDAVSARPGHSEHQTGLAIDIRTVGYYDQEKYLIQSDYDWFKEHADEYGFIIRYPQGKTNITGYDEEPWQLRYVGKEVAKEIKELDITFDEYYYLKELNANNLVMEETETVEQETVSETETTPSTESQTKPVEETTQEEENSEKESETQEEEKENSEKEPEKQEEQTVPEKSPVTNLEVSEEPLEYLEKVTLKEGARVYTTKFDMEKKENSKKPYLDYNDIRTGYVVVIKVDEELKHINLQETELIQQYLQDGGDIVGYLVANENSYNKDGEIDPTMVEGFYLEEDIVPQEKAKQYTK